MNPFRALGCRGPEMKMVTPDVSEFEQHAIWRTRGGSLAWVVEVWDEPLSGYELFGVIYEEAESPCCGSATWTANGRYLGAAVEHHHDLVERLR